MEDQGDAIKRFINFIIALVSSVQRLQLFGASPELSPPLERLSPATQTSPHRTEDRCYNVSSSPALLSSCNVHRCTCTR
ncbi:hypothetical protein INR49_002241 [Caranx melampygus]|nr:hypothetical protein INR49_002241 [Caranx melampygus]